MSVINLVKNILYMVSILYTFYLAFDVYNDPDKFLEYVKNKRKTVMLYCVLIFITFANGWFVYPQHHNKEIQKQTDIIKKQHALKYVRPSLTLEEKKTKKLNEVKENRDQLYEEMKTEKDIINEQFDKIMENKKQ